MISKNIPVVILAGGNGTMLGVSRRIPKTMVEVNKRPLLDYIINYFRTFGFRKIIIAAGQGMDLIEDYVRSEKVRAKWVDSGLIVDVVNTGAVENTGARLARLKDVLKNDSHFVLTYGDVIADVPMDKLLQFHEVHGRSATLTAVHAPSRFRILGLHSVRDEVLGFADKPILQKDYISGGFYVLSSEVLSLPVITENPKCSFEFDVLQDMVSRKQVMAYRHDGYWHAIDTERDVMQLSQYLGDHGASY